MTTLFEYTLEAESLTVLIDPLYKGTSLFSMAKMYTRRVLLVLLPFNKSSCQLDSRFGSQKVLPAIDCSYNNNLDSCTGYVIVDGTAKELQRKLANLTKKRQLVLANQMQLAKLKLARMH